VIPRKLTTDETISVHSSWNEYVKVTESSTFAIPGAVSDINVDNMPHKDRKGKICILKKYKYGFVISSVS